MNGILRRASKADALPAFELRNLAILSQCVDCYGVDAMTKWTEGEMPAAYAEKLLNDGYVYVVDGLPNAPEQQLIIATGMLDVSTGFIDALFVHPQYMKLGIGKLMLDHLELIAKASGLVFIALESTLNAADFYRKCGFNGNKKSVYHSPRGFDLDCVVMQKQLV
ncbi:GNAT family N-acetyltransferase [Shewanella sp. OMA3-2]|uniref:GNAT family N-acetyltransferase n=1 Tax=Shewanella sp. OMA3-2 TaxID=2908650 RepID=UPI001F3E0769|nr:GNAT family N-acetyltransferase [Shewanella sp. OMA3-2]UJF23174.1 GNAT family N-acetyltransferase [Shewanella sp. OMA3-2]